MAATPTAPNYQNRPRIPGVRRVLAVSSGKGGVGKSTVSVNLACALHRLGHRVGLLDADLYGPNLPMMLGIRDEALTQGDKILPFTKDGIQMISMGLLVPEDQPVVWRGPMLHKAIQQFMFQVLWHNLDYLIADLPPGTGDAQLSLAQQAHIDGAVIVTTPQKVSVHDVRKAIRMFGTVEIPVLGVVENMAYFTPPGHTEKYEIFGSGGGAAIEAEFDIPLLAQLPIDLTVREGGDEGSPPVLSHPDSLFARAFLAAAEAVHERASQLPTGEAQSEGGAPTGEATINP